MCRGCLRLNIDLNVITAVIVKTVIFFRPYKSSWYRRTHQNWPWENLKRTPTSAKLQTSYPRLPVMFFDGYSEADESRSQNWRLEEQINSAACFQVHTTDTGGGLVKRTQTTNQAQRRSPAKDVLSIPERYDLEWYDFRFEQSHVLWSTRTNRT